MSDDLSLTASAAQTAVAFLEAQGSGGLASELMMPSESVATIVQLLRDKKQLIFYGPPGTGKTYSAMRIAEAIAGSTDRVELVQFHPSYEYEDFIQGYRPAAEAGEVRFVLRNGPLVRLAERARADSEHDFVMVIDEINRGNISRVFGELYFLLEYRSRGMRLQYADEGAPAFSMPANVYIVGTMNSADRSIALVDGALRRRFYFVPFFPLELPVAGLLRRWLAERTPAMAWVADVLDAANRLLETADRRDAAVGPSYFMRPELDERWVRLIWEYSVLPYLEEQLLGNEALLAELALDALRAGLEAPVASVAGSESDDADEASSVDAVADAN
jgi:5-methylcytosine-specific restriction enzyme B